MKPGYKTTEFWLTLLAMLMGALMASGALGVDGMDLQIAGMVVVVLAKLGYSVPRAGYKKAAIPVSVEISEEIGDDLK